MIPLSFDEIPIGVVARAWLAIRRKSRPIRNILFSCLDTSERQREVRGRVESFVISVLR